MYSFHNYLVDQFDHSILYDLQIKMQVFLNFVEIHMMSSVAEKFVDRERGLRELRAIEAQRRGTTR